jgi:hypothetical protein
LEVKIDRGKVQQRELQQEIEWLRKKIHAERVASGRSPLTPPAPAATLPVAQLAGGANSQPHRTAVINGPAAGPYSTALPVQQSWEEPRPTHRLVQGAAAAAAAASNDGGNARSVAMGLTAAPAFPSGAATALSSTAAAAPTNAKALLMEAPAPQANYDHLWGRAPPLPAEAQSRQWGARVQLQRHGAQQAQMRFKSALNQEVAAHIPTAALLEMQPPVYSHLFLVALQFALADLIAIDVPYVNAGTPGVPSPQQVHMDQLLARMTPRARHLWRNCQPAGCKAMPMIGGDEFVAMQVWEKEQEGLQQQRMHLT